MGNKPNRGVVGGGIGGWVLSLVLSVLMVAPTRAAAQADTSAELAAFQTRLEAYVAIHRKFEGPTPPMQMTTNMGEVHRLRNTLRTRIKDARGNKGSLTTPGLVDVFKQIISSTLTLADIVNVSEEVQEHTPPRMPKVRANAPLPPNAPFVTIPPPLLKALPHLPPELRYVTLSGALIIWDQHADLVVDIMPRLFDPLIYSKKTGLPSRSNQMITQRAGGE